MNVEVQRILVTEHINIKSHTSHDNCRFKGIHCHKILYTRVNKLQNSVVQMRKINQIHWNDMWESSGFLPTAKPKFWCSGQSKFHNRWNHCKRDNCSLRSLGFFISAALPNEISAFHSRLLIPEHVILLSTFNHSDKRLSACQFYNLALNESTVQYISTGNICMWGHPNLQSYLGIAGLHQMKVTTG